MKLVQLYSPDAAEIRRPGHTETAVRVSLVAADQLALVERDVGAVQQVVAVPHHGDAGVVLRHRGLVPVGRPVTNHPAAIQPRRHPELGTLHLHLAHHRISRFVDWFLLVR